MEPRPHSAEVAPEVEACQSGSRWELLRAASEGNVDALRKLRESGCDIHANRNAALQAAVSNGRLELVQFLLENGCTIHNVDSRSIAAAQENAYWKVFDYLTDAGIDGIKELRPTIEAMTRELLAAAPIYQPSSYWRHFNELHLDQLARGGMARFKRSINQYYFNFVPYSPFDPQLLSLLKWWILHPTATPFRARLIDPDIRPEDGTRLPVKRSVFTVMARRKQLGKITRLIQMLIYRFMVCMLWDYTRAHDRMRLLEKLEEPRIGSPIEILDGERLISQDLAHSVLECNAIFERVEQPRPETPLRIAEVGAGYGRLGHVLLTSIECKYFVFDIPPGLCVSQWYLSQLFPEKNIFRFRPFRSLAEVANELNAADIAFLTPNQIELIPEDFFDVTINISSLHEMRVDQIDNMLRQIYRVTSRFVYLKQYKKLVNPHDKLVITEDCYPLPPGWRHTYYRTNAVDSRFFETVIESIQNGRPERPAIARKAVEGVV